MSSCDPYKPLPRLICLHGAGSSGAIFQVQGRKLFRALDKDFRFVFLDAPFPSVAGPGMRPVFEDSGPFYRWQCDESAADNFDITEDEVREEKERVRRYLLDALRLYHKPEDGTPVVGLVAFSQGARVATGLLSFVEKRLLKGCLQGLPHIKFAVIISATYPPLFLDDDDDMVAKDGVDSVTGKALCRIPSLHLHGSRDPWRSESKKLLKQNYDIGGATVVEFTGGHAVPTREQDVKEVVAAFRQLAAVAR